MREQSSTVKEKEGSGTLGFHCCPYNFIGTGPTQGPPLPSFSEYAIVML